MIIFQPRIYALRQYLHTNIYFHGEIERLFGYDLVYTEKEIQIPSGIHFCQANLDDEYFDCRLYCWYDDLEIPFRHGLVVYVSDEKANKDAMQKFENKVFCV